LSSLDGEAGFRVQQITQKPYQRVAIQQNHEVICL